MDDEQQFLQFKTLIERLQSVLASLCVEKRSSDETLLVRLRTGTVLTLAILQKMCAGKDPRSFDIADWREIACDVDDYAVRVDGQAYSTFVFELYATYIESGAESLRGAASNEHCDAIRALAVELREKTSALENGVIREAAYIEDCLWIGLEAMVKLLSAAAFSRLGNAGELLSSLADFGVAYGRLALLNREQTLLQEILDHQGKLDTALQSRYDSYLADLNAQSAQFQQLVRNAFDCDLRGSLQASAALAQEAGVREEDILRTEKDVDAFFLE